ncbi:MAG: ribonuclease III [Alphaproteobacteria bacterium]|nr:ribonuclease III [Alphaproteobacteria bacterium]
MEELQQILKYQFKNKTLLSKALTHGSVNPDVLANYERLEFLGDRVLGEAVAHLLYNIFPNESEGNLSQRFVRLVRKETVAEVALSLKLNEFIKVANEELRNNVNVLCDVCEAIIGAIYVDGGSDASIEFVNQHWRELIDKNVAPPKDAKSRLQEIAHVKGFGVPQYKVVGREGNEHEPIFEVEVSLGIGKCVTAKGRNKKVAEMAAAEAMLEKIN